MSPAARQDRDFGLWGETAEPAPDAPALPGDRDADVLVVGAGYTGLSTALHAARHGLSVICVDRERPGYGASGRNGGQVLPGFKTYPDHLVARFGVERGGAMAAFGAGIADRLFAVIAEHGIRCAATRSGWVHAGHHPAKLAEQRWKHDQWASRGAPVRWLDRDAIAAHLGSDAYCGGWLDERGGVVHPLSLARGLARAAAEAGAAVHGATPVTALTRERDGWRADAGGAVVRARHVVVATNGYTAGLVPKLAASVVTVESAQIATEPLPHDTLAPILPSGSAVSDTRRSLLYFRRSPDGRVMFGGRGGVIGATRNDSYRRLERALRTVFPRLSRIAVTHRWAGRLAATLDHLPHLHESAPGLIAAIGCNGRGVAYSVALGEIVAERLRRGHWEGAPLAVSPIAPIPLHPFRQLGGAIAASWLELRDRLGGEFRSSA